MQRILPFLLLTCLVSNLSLAQTKVQDVLWEDNFTSSIDPQVFPNLASRYASTLRGTEGIMMIIPKDLYASYDPTYLVGSGDQFRIPVRIVKSFSGNEVYDSIKLETTGVYFINQEDMGWERSFSFSTNLTDSPPETYRATYMGKPWRMSNSRGNSDKLVCKNCKEFSFDGSIDLYANFGSNIAFQEISSTYTNSLGGPYRSSRIANNFPNPFSADEFKLPEQTPWKFSEMGTLQSMKEYFCQLCAKDIGNETSNEFVYYDCLQNATPVYSDDYFIHFGLKGFRLVGYRTSIATDLKQDMVQAEEKRVQAVDALGKKIEDIDAYSGFMIEIYEDGSKRKVMK